MKKRIGKIVSYIGAVLGLYVGVWLMLLEPIIEACKLFEIGELAGAVIFVTILKVILAPTVGLLIYFTLAFIGGIIYFWGGADSED